MKRKTYRASELVAGKTIFIALMDWRCRFEKPLVCEHLIGSERDPLPAPGEITPFRVPPSYARLHFGEVGLFKTRRAALRDAEQQVQTLRRLRGPRP